MAGSLQETRSSTPWASQTTSAKNFAKIADYDFSNDVPVSVLGHIFEQSVSDIENMRAKAQGQPTPKTTKRKREGVVYTPHFVTRFIVEETIGKTLSERFAAERPDSIVMLKLWASLECWWR
jgi:hypothetical protein